MNKRVALIIAHEGFQPIEYGEPRRILEKHGVAITTVSDKAGEAISAFGDRVAVDATLGECEVNNYDGIFIIGGPGALQHLDRPEVHQLLRAAKLGGKLWGAICIAPRILAHADLLRGQRATGWNNDEQLADILVRAGAHYVAEPCVVDGALVTADGPVSAAEFGETILRKLG